MKKLTNSEYRSLIQDAKILSKDRFGLKVLQLHNDLILKLFRVKHLFSSAHFIPYSRRFSKNAKTLVELGVPCVTIQHIYRIPSIKKTAVLYRPLPGETLRDHLSEKDMSTRTAEKLALFIARLHESGCYFRSIHFGNIIVVSEHTYGLIDVSDMKIRRRLLGIRHRIRNFRHFTRYEIDRKKLAPQIDCFLDKYSEQSNLSKHQFRKLKENFQILLRR